MVFSGLVLAVSGVVVIVIAELAARGRMGINGAAGIRLPSLMTSDEAWSRGHQAARLPMSIAGVFTTAGGLVAVLVPSRALANVSILVGTVLGILGVLAASVLAVRAARASVASDEGETSQPTEGLG
jgi:hypothetical protein